MKPHKPEDVTIIEKNIAKNQVLLDALKRGIAQAMTRLAAIVFATLLSSPAMAGESVAIKRPPTDFDYCVIQANAAIEHLYDLTAKLAARAAAAERQVAALQEPEPVAAKPAKQKRVTRNDKCGSMTAHWYKNQYGRMKYRCR